MQVTKVSPDSYLSEVAEDVKSDMIDLDKTIKTIAGENISKVLWEGVFWGGSEQSIIGYGDLSYTNSKKEEVKWFIVGLALQKNYISLYINTVKDNQYLPETYKGKLGKVKHGKSSISFKSLSEVDLPELKKLLTEAFAN